MHPRSAEIRGCTGAGTYCRNGIANVCTFLRSSTCRLAKDARARIRRQLNTTDQERERAFALESAFCTTYSYKYYCNNSHTHTKLVLTLARTFYFYFSFFFPPLPRNFLPLLWKTPTFRRRLGRGVRCLFFFWFRLKKQPTPLLILLPARIRVRSSSCSVSKLRGKKSSTKLAILQVEPT